VVVTITGLGADAFSYVYYDIYLTKKHNCTDIITNWHLCEQLLNSSKSIECI